MAEYIEREAVLDKRRKVTEYDEAAFAMSYQAVPVEDIEAIPAADVVELPCKVGDTVWVYNERLGCIYKNTVLGMKIWGVGKHKNTIVVEYTNKHGEKSTRKFTWAQMGKSLFLAKEEAERALKGERE